MPPKNNNIQLGEGTIYIKTEKGEELLGEITEAVEAEFYEDAEPIVRINNTEEVTLSFALVGEAAARMEALFRDFARAVGFICTNRRVAHLMKYGRTKRVRKKNLVRAAKIAAKEAGL
jgi:hypothetical protein